MRRRGKLTVCVMVTLQFRLGRVTENNNKEPKWRFVTSRGVHLNCAIMAMLYIRSIGNEPSNTIVVFKMRDNVPSPIYSPVCNALRQ